MDLQYPCHALIDHPELRPAAPQSWPPLVCGRSAASPFENRLAWRKRCSARRPIQKFGDTDAYWVAMNYAYRNDRARALQWLNRAYEQKEMKLAIEIVGERLFRNVTDDPAYKGFLRKMNLPDYRLEYIDSGRAVARCVLELRLGGCRGGVADRDYPARCRGRGLVRGSRRHAWCAHRSGPGGCPSWPK